MKKILLICTKKKAEDIILLHVSPTREHLYYLYIAISGQIVLCYGWLDELGVKFIHSPVYPSDKEVKYKGISFSHYQWNFYLDELKRVNKLINT